MERCIQSITREAAKPTKQCHPSQVTHTAMNGSRPQRVREQHSFVTIDVPLQSIVGIHLSRDRFTCIYTKCKARHCNAYQKIAQYYVINSTSYLPWFSLTCGVWKRRRNWWPQLPSTVPGEKTKHSNTKTRKAVNPVGPNFPSAPQL